MNLLFLAVGTVHGASSRHFRFRERFPTQWTGLPTAMIHLEVPEVIPHFSVCILVIAERCSMMAQGTLNDFLDGNGKSLPFLFGHSANPFRRPDASRKKGFIGINIAKSRDDGLIKDKGFNLGFLMTRPFFKIEMCIRDSNMIGSYQVKCLFTKGIEPFEAKGLFMSGNLENTISGGIDCLLYTSCLT